MNILPVLLEALLFSVPLGAEACFCFAAKACSAWACLAWLGIWGRCLPGLTATPPGVTTLPLLFFLNWLFK